jgi:pilus assembly protein FimV
MNKQLRLPLALALALGSSQVLALGLGQIQVKSALNQPLDAEIELLSPTAAELENLRVQLASSRDAQRVGSSASGAAYVNLQFSVERSGGKHVIKVRTPDRVTTPFINFLLDVNWGRGRLLREYTVLLDPPHTAPATARTRPATTTPAPEPRRAPAQPAAPAPSTTAAPAPAPSAPATTAAAAPSRPAPAAPAYTGEQYGPVASGETLWAVAQQVRPDASVSMNQVMLALLRANPEAFIGGNINRLKRGAILRIPSRADFDALSVAEAAAQVRSQMADWRGDQAAPTPRPAEPRPVETARAAPAATPADRPRVQVVPPAGGDTQAAQSGAAERGAGTSELRAELARSREEVASRDREVRELRSRVQELEKIQSDSERLISMKDGELQALQQRLAELQAAAAADRSAAPASGTPAATPAAAEPVAAAPADAAGGETAPAADAASAPDAADTAAAPPPRREPRTPRTTPAASTPAPAPAPAAPPPPPPAPAWYENIWLLGGGAALVLGLLGLLAVRRRSSAAAAPASSPRRYDAGSAAASIPSVPAAMAASTEEEDQEALLLDAVAESPSDLSRHLELVQHYYSQSDEEAFEGAAEAMYAQVDDAEDLRWKQVLAMGRELLPDHPLFSSRPAPAAAAPLPETWAQPEPAASEQPEELDFDGFSDGFESPSEPPAPPVRQAEPEPQPGYDFDFESPGTSAAEPAVDLSEDLGADLGAVDEDASATKLELARAYLDMGDVEGARAMLEEVANEGNAGQRSEAKRLLDEIR